MFYKIVANRWISQASNNANSCYIPWQHSDLPATRMSQANASSRPPPKAVPSIAAIVGTGRLAEKESIN